MSVFIDRPVATAMAFLAVLVLGVYSYLNTPLELEPKENLPEVTIMSVWTGAPPESVQTQVTSPIEEAVSAVKSVRKITSSSMIGTSNVTLEFDPKADMEFVLLALREELSKLRRILPTGVRPAITRYVPEDFRVQPFLRYTVSGGYPLQALREMVKDKIEFGIGAVKGVAQVELTGGSDPEIRLVLDKVRLKTYSIHPYQVILAVSENLKTHPSGRLRDGSREVVFKFAQTIRDLTELGETVVAYSGGNVLRVRDLASIETTHGDIPSIHRINGNPTVSFTVYKEKGTNTIGVAREVKAKLEEIRGELPPDLVFETVDDESEEIRKNLRDLTRLAGIIAAIVFAMVVLILRRISPSLLILSSIAFSVVITFNLIYLFRISLNMLTLGALALGFGMFVDNAIVVFENILRLREGGLSAREAAVRGPKEVFTAVLASTLTTVAVFFSFPFFQGRLKIFYLPLAIVIASSLLASLLVSFSLIPALSPRLIEVRRRRKDRPPGGRFDRFLGFCLRHPLEVLLLAAAALIGSYAGFKSEVAVGDWFRFTSREYLFVQVGMPAGTDIERTDEAIRAFEEKVLAQPYPTEMNAYVGRENANVRIGFPPEIERSYHPYVLKEELIQLATQYAGVNIYVSGFDPQSYSSSMSTASYLSSRIKFMGYNLKKLKDITADLERTLRRNPRIREVRITSSRYGWFQGGSFENILKIDKARLRRYDIDPLYLYGHLQTLIRGRFGAAMKIRTGGEEIDISVKFPDAETLDLRGLREALIRTRGGEELRIGEVAELIERPIAGSIDRENQQFQQTVSWDFRGPARAEERYRTALFNSLHLPAGFSVSLEETWRMTEKEQTQIHGAIVVALLLIFMILGALYESFVQPLLILLAVPLGLIGVFAAFVLAGANFDSSAYIGVILLAGIIVNNAILLVDHINRRRREGRDIVEAVVLGTRERLRPIFMTTSTTVLGILPLLLVSTETGKRQIWSSLALCTAGGLVTSTLFMIVVIPVLYIYGDRLRLWAAAKWAEARGVGKR